MISSHYYKIKSINRELHTTICLTTMASDLPLTRSAWQDRLSTLPGSPDAIPSFFFGHGSPLMAFSSDGADRDTRWHSVIKHVGPESPLANFLRDFGPTLLAKYQPKGILVFSAHWETKGEKLGTSFPPFRSILMSSLMVDKLPIMGTKTLCLWITTIPIQRCTDSSLVRAVTRRFPGVWFSCSRMYYCSCASTISSQESIAIGDSHAFFFI